MNFKFTLSGNRQVNDSNDASSMFNQVRSENLHSGNFTCGWHDADYLGWIELSLRNISMTFEISKIPVDKFLELQREITQEKTAGLGASKIIYESALAMAKKHAGEPDAQF